MEVPKSDSIWGEYNILNSRATSEVTFQRVYELVRELDFREGIYVGIRAMVNADNYKLPLRVFSEDPQKTISSINDMVVALSGPLKYNEALAAGYILETAAITRDILDGFLQTITKERSPVFEQLASTPKGGERFVPLGLFTLSDYIAAMVAYRNHLQYFEGLDLSEESNEDMSLIVGMGRLPLARAFRRDGYVIGNEFQTTLDQHYVGNRSLFIPFAGVFGGHPKTAADWEMVGAGIYAGIRVFREIQDNFENTNKTPSLPIPNPPLLSYLF